jgi:hypothetical protein
MSQLSSARLALRSKVIPARLAKVYHHYAQLVLDNAIVSDTYMDILLDLDSEFLCCSIGRSSSGCALIIKKVHGYDKTYERVGLRVLDELVDVSMGLSVNPFDVEDSTITFV